MRTNCEPKLNLKLAQETQAELEQIVRDLKDSLDRCETLHESFRQKFLKLFEDPTTPAPDLDPALRNILAFSQGNLAGQALAHLRYAVDLAELACGLTAHYRGGATAR